MPKENPTPAGDDTLTPKELAKSKRAYDELAGERAAIAANRLPVLRFDLEASALAARGVADRIAKAGLSSLLALLPPKLLNPAYPSTLGVRAWAAIHAGRVLNVARGAATEVQVDVALVHEALEIEARMQALCEYHLSDDAKVRLVLDALRPGTGYRDLANDLLGYADVVDANLAVLKDDKKHFRAADRKRGRELGEQILEIISDAEPKDVKVAVEAARRAYAVLAVAYEDVAAACRFIERHEPDLDARYPSLVTAGRIGAKGGKKKATKKG